MSQYEYIIAGAGAAGLTLAFMLMGDKNTKKPTLIIDRDEKVKNDRTWCFWEKGDNIFENLVSKSWDQALFQSDNFEHTFALSPYRYKMIRGADFYASMKSELSRYTEITWVTEEIADISPKGVVSTNKASYQGQMVFDSRKPLSSFDHWNDYTQLLQHFKGYFIETPAPRFDPGTFTYMDLKVDQEGDFRFGYVLPLSETRALVEYTLFSPSLLDQRVYTEKLENYIGQSLQIDQYSILEEEFGVIPMTDYPFKVKVSDQLFNIGICGGFAKPSTGYTFLRSQKTLSKMVQNISEGLSPDQDLPYHQKRFKKYDGTLLRVLFKNNNKGKEAFTEMFRQNGMLKMLRFLDEETSLNEELSIMSSTPLLTFGKAFFESLRKG